MSERDVKSGASAPEWQKPVLQLAELLVGNNLLEADRIIDEVRLLAWSIRFGGIDKVRAAYNVDTSPTALRLFERVENLTLMQVGALLDELRLLMWMGNFASAEGSAFHRELTAHIQRGNRPASALD